MSTVHMSLMAAGLVAEFEVVKCAVRLSDCAVEFDGDFTYCREYIDELWNAVDRLKAMYIQAEPPP
jgi:hypothetical protein